MNDEKKGLRLFVSIIKQFFQYGFIFIWSYYVCINIYNSTLMKIYEGLFPDGISSSQTLPADFIRSLPGFLSIVVPVLIAGYLVSCIIEYVLRKDMIQSIRNIIMIGIIAVCIKIPEYILTGFYFGNEFLLRQVIIYIVIGIVIIFIIKYLKRKQNIT